MATDLKPDLRQDRPVSLEDKPFRPLKLWAAIGAAFLAVEIYALTGWLTSDNFSPTPLGPTPVPSYMTVFLRTWEVLAFPALLGFLWFFLIKPWRRDGRISTDGLFCLVFATIWWQDPASSYAAPLFTYNAAAFNHGNWLNHIPGWVMPGAHNIAEPVILAFPVYVYGMFGGAIVGNVLMRKAKQRWPGLTKVQLCLVCFAFFCSLDLLVEPFILTFGFASYTSVVKELTIFHGHYYQYPLYEAPLWGATWAAWSCLRYFRDDKGRTIAERGIDEVNASPRAKTTLRFLALAGVCNLILLGYNVAIQPFVLNSDPIVQDQLNRSYFMNGICGEGTDYACYGPDVPFPRPGSAHIGSDGQLKNPKGADFQRPAQKQ